MSNFITSEEFLSQSKHIQQTFIDWWKMKVGDLYSTEEANDEIDIIVRSDEFAYGLNNSFTYDNGVIMKSFKPIPLLQTH